MRRLVYDPLVKEDFFLVGWGWGWGLVGLVWGEGGGSEEI